MLDYVPNGLTRPVSKGPGAHTVYAITSGTLDSSKAIMVAFRAHAEKWSGRHTEIKPRRET
jgi:hypothetical protein